MKTKSNRISVLACSRYLLFCLLMVSLSGCLVIKRSSTKAGKNLYETFYTEDGMQYFFKPISLQNSNGGELKIDFSFRNRDIETDSVIANFTVVDSTLVKEIESFRLISGAGTEVAGVETQLLFNEKKSKLYNSRFTTKLPLDGLMSMYASSFGITILSGQNTYMYEPVNKTTKTVSKLNEYVFDLLRD